MFLDREHKEFCSEGSLEKSVSRVGASGADDGARRRSDVRRRDQSRWHVPGGRAHRSNQHLGGCRHSRRLGDRSARHFLRPAAEALGIYFPGFGFHSLRREAITAISREIGIGQAMNLAGHTKVDMTMLYELADRTEQERGIKAFQERILGKPKGGIQ
jgi:hypothetical protein